MSAKPDSRQFVDTNIFLYAYDTSEPGKQKAASSLIRNLWNKGLGCISIQVLQELYVNLTRKVNLTLGANEAKVIVADLAQWQCHIPDPMSIMMAMEIEEKYKLSFWDSMIICSARSMKCDLLWTEDLNQGQNYDGVLVKNPFG